MIELSGFQRDCLYVIEGISRPTYPTVKDALEEYYQQELTDGRLRQNLEELTQGGYIGLDPIADQDVYSLTPEGYSSLVERRYWEDTYFRNISSN